MKTDLTIYNYPENVDGIFYCERKLLTTLKGSPLFVKTRFKCYRNKFVNLLYCPKSYSIGVFLKIIYYHLIIFRKFLTLLFYYEY